MRNPPLVLAMTIFLGGCAAGGGPFIGYGTKRGLVWGVEAGAGVPVAQVAAGIQNRDRFTYFRVDATGNTAGFKREGDLGVGGRFGAGYGWGATHRGGVFAMGANVGYNFERHDCPDDNGTVGLLGLELRYAGGETQLVATSRVEQVQDLCWH